MDEYHTPHRAVIPLLPFIRDVNTFCEPCRGAGDLVHHLYCHEKVCTWQSDIKTGTNGCELGEHAFTGADCVITNPPWTFQLMDPLLRHFLKFKPVWFLLAADYAHNQRSAWSMERCTHYVSVGRVKWMTGSSHTGKDNAAWYRFEADWREGPRFFPRPTKRTLLDIMEAA
jgi:hypothetical protein